MMSICTLPEGGSVMVHLGDSTRTFRKGDRVDFDAIAVPAKLPAKDGEKARPAETWRDVLGEFTAAFEPEAAQPEITKRAAAAPAKE